MKQGNTVIRTIQGDITKIDSVAAIEKIQTVWRYGSCRGLIQLLEMTKMKEMKVFSDTVCF